MSAPSPLRRLVMRIGDPLRMSPADRSLLAVVFSLGAVLSFVALVNFGEGWPYLRADVAPEARRLLGRASLFLVGPWALLLGAVLVLRRRMPRSRVLVHATVQLYALSIGLFTVLSGPFYSPGWIAFLGGAIVGFLLFDRWVTTAGVATFFAIVVGGAWLIERGDMPFAAELRNLSGLGGDDWRRVAVCAVVFSSLTLAVSSWIISRWREREAGFEVLSRTDALTGLTNRRRFHELLERELGRARRYHAPLALLLIDVDHFKKVNDTHGHLAGDRVLQAVAHTLEGGLRDVDVVARWGGEEFIVLCPDTSALGAEEVAGRLLRLVGDTAVVVDTHSVKVTASIGLASVPHPAVTRVEDLIKLADEALYRAKKDGRNRVAVGA